MRLFYFAPFLLCQRRVTAGFTFQPGKQSIQDYLPQEAKKPVTRALNILVSCCNKKVPRKGPRPDACEHPWLLRAASNLW